jgi:hypothetical protein
MNWVGCDRSDGLNPGRELLRLETILVELKREKRALETAIAALESLQKCQRRPRATSRRAKCAVAAAANKRRIPEIQMQTVVGLGGGQLIPFPGAKRFRRGKQRSREIKA